MMRSLRKRRSEQCIQILPPATLTKRRMSNIEEDHEEEPEEEREVSRADSTFCRTHCAFIPSLTFTQLRMQHELCCF